MQNEWRFAIIGCGTIAPTHAGAIRKIAGTRLVAFADIDQSRARKMANRFGVSKIYTDAEQVFTDPEVDIVCLCTPSGIHANHAVAAMRAGKHVIVEKPADVTLEAVDRMIAAEDETGRKLTVISQHRFDPGSQLVKEAIDSGKLGKIILATADVKWWRAQSYYDSGDWRGTLALDGGGALMNQAIHTVDLLQWLAGPVRSIYGHARTAAHERIEVEDIAAAVLTFHGGAIGTLVATTAAYTGWPVRIDLIGTNGTAILEGDRLMALTLKDGQAYHPQSAAAHAVSVAKGGTASVKDDALREPSATVAEAGAAWGDAHQLQIEEFLDALRSGRKPLIDGRAARKPLEIILGVYKSSLSGDVVEFPL